MTGMDLADSLKALRQEIDGVEGFDVPSHDYRGLTYSSGNLTQVTYKTGGAGGTTVATLTLAYDGGGNLVSLTKT